MLRCFQGAQVVEDRGPQQGRQSRRKSPCACEDKQLGIAKTRMRAKGHVPRELLYWWRRQHTCRCDWLAKYKIWTTREARVFGAFTDLCRVKPVVGAVEYCR